MAKRKRNPSWLVTSLIGIGGVIVGGILAGSAMTRRLGPQYYYWAEERGFGNWIPVIQAPDGSQYELPAQITEMGALSAAKEEVRSQGGVANKGKPRTQIATNPHRVQHTSVQHRRRPRTLRAVV